MTVVPGRARDTVNLICDQCGDSLAGVTAILHEPDVVWTLIAECGWDGSPFALGPHRCPACATSSLAAPRDPAASAPVTHDVPQAWHVNVEDLPQATVLTPSGGIDVRVADILREALTTAVTGRQDVVLDLSHVVLIDSTGLGLLVRAHRDCRQRGRTLCLVAPSRFVLTVLHTMRLDTAFLTFDHRQQALTCLAAQPSATARARGG